MSDTGHIPVRNLYHMLVYAWDQLEESGIADTGTEEQHDVCNLLARVLCSGLQVQIKRGLVRGYVSHEEETSRPRGRIDIAMSGKRHTLWRHQLACRYDELEEDVMENRIIRSTLDVLLRLKGLSSENVRLVRVLHDGLQQITPVRVTSDVFKRVLLKPGAPLYRFLIHVCEHLHSLCLPEPSSGSYRMRDFFQDDRRMAVLFQKFAFNFYKRHVLDATVEAPHIAWQVSAAEEEAMSHLPRMETDVTIVWSERRLILDCKYYREALLQRYETQKLHSSNLYQLFAYLKNQCLQSGWQDVEGVLLYPATSQSFDWSYMFGPHRVRVATVDLRAHWTEVEAQMIRIISIPNEA